MLTAMAQSTQANANVHSTVNFDPAGYEVVDYIDNRQPQYHGQPIQALEAEICWWKAEIRRYFPTCAKVTAGNVAQRPEHNINKCRHCGCTNIRYIAVVLHQATGEHVVFGTDCIEHLNFPSHSAFKAAQLKARAAQGHARLRVWRKRNEFVEAHPELKRWLDTDPMSKVVHRGNAFAGDIIAKLAQYGSLSDRQVECLLQSLERDLTRQETLARRAQDDAARRLTAQPAPIGRHAVRGKVLHVKVVEDGFGRRDTGMAFKMLVELDGGARVWCSVPNSLLSEMANDTGLKDKQVEFTATFALKHGPNPDPLFAFGSRPTKGKVL